MLYEKLIKGITNLVKRRPTMAPILRLTDALGCRSCSYYAMSGLWQAEAVKVPPPGSEDLITSTLLWMFRSGLGIDQYTKFAILDGLMHHHRWRLALDSIADAYAFADLLIALNIFMESSKHATGRSTPEISDRLRRTTHPLVCGVLNEWLRPSTPFNIPPDTSTLVRALYGEAWCSMFLEEVDEGGIFKVIDAWRPPFMPGLLPAHLETQDLPLPSI